MMSEASVVITNHDHGRFVGQAIDSALAQTHRAARVVVVDDGSTDDSSRIIRGYGARLHAVFQGHRGQADAMLAGLRASAGQVLLFLDSDDVLYPEALAEICAQFHAGVAKVQVRLDLIDARGHPLGRQTPPMAMPSGDLAPMVLKHGWYPAPPTSGNAFSREALETLLPVPDSYARLGAADGKLAVSDHYLSVLAALRGEVVSVARPLGAYRLHGGDPGGPALLAEIRRRIERAAALSDLVHQHAGARKVATPSRLALGTPNRVKERLLSLRLDPRGHAPPSDTRWRLVRAGLAAAWTVPWSPRRMRMVQSLAMIVLAAMPTVAIGPLLAACVLDHARPRWVSRLVGMEV